MLHARRWKLSAAQRTDMWNRWKAVLHRPLETTRVFRNWLIDESQFPKILFLRPNPVHAGITSGFAVIHPRTRNQQSGHELYHPCPLKKEPRR